MGSLTPIPAQPLIWGPLFQSGTPHCRAGPHPRRGAGRDFPSPKGTPRTGTGPNPSTGHCNPVPGLGCDPTSRSVLGQVPQCHHRVTAGDRPRYGSPIPNGTPIPSRDRPSYPGTGTVTARPPRYQLPIPVQAVLSRYRSRYGTSIPLRVPKPVRDPHPGTGTVMASPSRQGLLLVGTGVCARPHPVSDPVPIPVRDPRPPLFSPRSVPPQRRGPALSPGPASAGSPSSWRRRGPRV